MADMVKLETAVAEDVDRRLDEIAALRGIGKAELVADVLQDYAKPDPGYFEFLEEGLDDWRNGRLVDHSAVKAAFEKRFPPAA